MHMERDRFTSSRYQEYLAAGYDPYHAFIGVVPHLIDEARHAARNQAVSYRDFHVGSGLFVVDLETSRTAAMSGGNNTPFPGAQKYCAEMNAIDQAEAAGYNHAIGMVVAGTTDPEKILEVTGRKTPTLHPCAECREKMAHSEIIDADTLVITVGLEEDVAQVHTYGEMSMIYELEDNDNVDMMIPASPLDLDNWERRQLLYDRFMNEANDLADPPAIARLALSAVAQPPA